MLEWLCLVHAILLVASNVSAFPDWLVEEVTTKTTLTKTPRGTLLLSNGLIGREFLLTPDFTTIDFYSYQKQSSLLRAMSPEAVISLNDVSYNISGVLTGVPRAYLNRTALAQDIHANPRAFHYVSHSTSAPQAPFAYKPKRGAPKDIVWPPAGLRLDVRFRAPFGAPSVHQEVTVVLHYEMYNGIPLMAKWLTVEAPSNAQENINLTILAVEALAVNWQWAEQGYNWLSIETDQPHGTEVQWSIDPQQHLMPGSFQYNVACSFKPIPSLPLTEFSESFRVHELVHASNDPERVGLAKKRKLRLLAPQTQENPIFFHMTDSSDKAVLKLIDQLYEVGFEMLIYSFGSGFSVESTDEKYLERMKTIISYANSKGIEVGGYDLIDWTRTVKKEWRADTHSHYQGACYASGWADFLLERVLNFVNKTGLSNLETDGPYPGYECHSTNHSHHNNAQDSVYKQLMLQGNFYKILQELGVYTNQPDKYFYQGGSKTAMGYNEHQFSLPRWQDLSVSRQGMFDDTFDYTPTVGWMFLPLVQYHGGGAAAIFEPLSQHMVEYEWGLAQYFGAGVAVCYRGYRVYDTEETKMLVKKWVDFYKLHRSILTSDIIHVQRADMQGIDCFMHVNPRLQEKALAMVFNPTDMVQQTNLTLPLYYSGLHSTALISQEGAPPVAMALDRKYNVEISISLKPLQITWFLIQ
ncbi:hypothetical protein CAPTEDRAFT_226414 [Capitella teleta]|uniref:Alpha-galactosidase n=1 Tax=Capitella teleta TaxID=283909 RepID=R7VIH1_CAPTE|nr:hypothetical protein CAPTEDRAFT_226414 [Capitella teleta]|eukprot:ELU18638.1 hypothetical protein CAPTEDRAFT_226414 [Capitella teleta]